MTRIEQIRQRHAEYVVAKDHEGHWWGGQEIEQHAMISRLLTLWDTRDAALRTLVEQHRERAKVFRASVTSKTPLRIAQARMDAASAFEQCADALDAILKETTP